jgi:hypothetical protein
MPEGTQVFLRPRLTFSRFPALCHQEPTLDASSTPNFPQPNCKDQGSLCPGPKPLQDQGSVTVIFLPRSAQHRSAGVGR